MHMQVYVPYYQPLKECTAKEILVQSLSSYFLGCPSQRTNQPTAVAKNLGFHMQYWLHPCCLSKKSLNLNLHSLFMKEN